MPNQNTRVVRCDYEPPAGAATGGDAAAAAARWTYWHRDGDGGWHHYGGAIDLVLADAQERGLKVRVERERAYLP